MRAKFSLILVLTMIAALAVAPIPGKPFGIVPGIDLAGGAELRYRLLFEPGFTGDRREAARQAADVLRLRVASSALQEPRIHVHGDDTIVIQLPGVDSAGLEEVKRRIGPMGQLELHAAAEERLQRQHRADGIVPVGYKVVVDHDRTPILIEERPVVEGRHVVLAEPRLDSERGSPRWVTAFELDAEGAKRFDEAAERLYHQRPRGRIVILLDGEVRSAPVVGAPAFHGRGQISGRRE